MNRCPKIAGSPTNAGRRFLQLAVSIIFAATTMVGQRNNRHPGASELDEETVTYVTRPLLDIVATSNFPILNPEVMEAIVAKGGSNSLRGAALSV